MACCGCEKDHVDASQCCHWQTFQRESVAKNVYERAAQLDRVRMGLLRLGLIVVLCWIGALKFADYKADAIVPLVVNSPLMSYLHN